MGHTKKFPLSKDRCSNLLFNTFTFAIVNSHFTAKCLCTFISFPIHAAI